MGRHLLALLTIGCLCGGAYLPTLNYPFAFDDIPNIVDEPNIRLRSTDLKNLKKAAIGRSKTRPVSNLSFALNYYFSGYRVSSYRMTNIVIHGLNGFLCYLWVYLTIRLYRSPKTSGLDEKSDRHRNPPKSDHRAYEIAWVTAAIWVVHPVQTQSVIYIVQRMNSLAVLFYLSALCLYIVGRQTHRPVLRIAAFVAIFGLFILALGSKPIAAMLPITLFLYEWIFFQKRSRIWLAKNAQYFVMTLILFALIAAEYLGPNPLTRVMDEYDTREFTMNERVFTELRVIVFYLSLLLYPLPGRFNVEHDFIISKSLVQPFSTLLALILLCSLFASIWKLARNHRLIAFAILWFYLHLVIESSIIPLELAFEHRLYLPSISILLILVYLYHEWVPAAIPRRIFGSVAVCTLALATSNRASIWQSSYVLWGDCVRKSPDKARPHLSFGAELAIKGQLDEAIAHYRRALQIAPNYPKAHDNLGLALLKQGQIDMAIERHREALRLSPKYAEAHVNLGVALATRGDHHEAIDHYRAALKFRPLYYVAQMNLALSLLNLNQHQKAIEHFMKAVEIDPANAEGNMYLAIVLGVEKEREKSRIYYQRALDVNSEVRKLPLRMAAEARARGDHRQALAYLEESMIMKIGDADAIHFRMALSHSALGDTDRAEGHYREAIRLNPEFADAHFNLGLLIHRQGKIEQAIDHYLAVLNLKSGNPGIHNNLGAAYFQKNDYAKAIEHYSTAIELNDHSAESYFNLGLVYERLSDTNSATRHYRTALKLRPDYPDAATGLQRVDKNQ